MRRTLAISQGELSALVSSPFAVIAYGLLVVLLALSLWARHRESRAEHAAPTREAAESEEPAQV
ncbi:MAG TPA: hypothetical protein VIP77_17835 [Jiangellaceae bacterium]